MNMLTQYQKNLDIQQVKGNWFVINSGSLPYCYLYNNNSGLITKLPVSFEQLSFSNISEQFTKLQELESEKYLEHFTPHKYLDLKKPTRLMMFMTSMCNLKCIYCHCNSTSHGEHMDKKLAFKTIDKYITHVKAYSGTTEDNIQITFMGGGEPLLQIQMIKEIVEYLEEQNIKGKYVLVTNGTVGNDDDWNWLIDRQFRITLSIDGNPEIQNTQRVFANSKMGTWTNLENRLDFLDRKSAKIHVRSTVTDTRNIDKICQYLEQFDCIETHSLEPVSIAGRGIDCSHYPQDLEEFYSKFFETYSKYLYHNPGRYKSAWFKPFKRMDGFCGAVYHNAVITHDGFVSLCTEMDSSTQYTYGNQFIVSHINEENPFISNKSLDFSNYHSVDNMEKCKNCIVKYKCGGGCYAKRHRDLTEGDVYYNSFCKNIIKLNLSYLIAIYEEKINE